MLTRTGGGPASRLPRASRRSWPAAHRTERACAEPRAAAAPALRRARALEVALWLFGLLGSQLQVAHAQTTTGTLPTAEPSTPGSARPDRSAGPAPEVAPSAVPEGRARLIHVAIAAEPREREALVGVLRELMQRLSVELEIEPVPRVERGDVLAPLPADAPLLARCFIDLRAARQAWLYVHDPLRDRVLERRVERAPGQEELAREELGHMLLASIEALLSGATLGAPRDELAAAASAQPARAPAAERADQPSAEATSDAGSDAAHGSWRLRGALLYELAAIGHGPGIAHGPQLAAIIAAPFPGPQLGVLLSAQYRFPLDAGGDPIGLRMHAFALRALCSLEPALSARVRLRIALGGGADVARVAPRGGQISDVALSDPRTLTLAVTRGLVGLDVRVSPVLALWAALAADVDLDRTHYVLVQRDGRDSELTAPWRVRPALSLGLVLP